MDIHSTEGFSARGMVSTYIALASFAIGTVFLALHFAFPQEDRIIIAGLIYVLLAVLVNTAVLLNLLFRFIFVPHARELTAIKALIVLSNVPVAVFYFLIVTSTL